MKIIKKRIENIIHNRLKFMSDPPYPLLKITNDKSFEIIVTNLTNCIYDEIKLRSEQ
jgi:hypothetical protein